MLPGSFAVDSDRVGSSSRRQFVKISVKMAIFTLATVAFQFGLAVLGWGGFAAFFSHPPRVAVAIVTVVLTFVALFGAGEQEDRGNRWVLIAFGVPMILIAFLPAYTDRKDLFTFNGDAIRWLGVVLFAAGGALRLWPVFVLGPRFSGLVAIQPGHMLVTTGVCVVVRNPSYLGMLVSALGWALAFRSKAGVLLVALLIPPLVGRMRAEEKLLRTHFGSGYDAYWARTPRLIPRVY
jgi:protein-S-isoprenylcysteine O-methyltransferase Ste14